MTEKTTPDPDAPTDLPTDVPADVPPAPPPSTAPPTAPPSSPRTSLRDRAYHFRSVLAVAVAGVVLGAAAGAGVTAVAQHDGQRGFDRAGFGPGPMPEGGQMPGLPGQAPPGPREGSGDQQGLSSGSELSG